MFWPLMLQSSRWQVQDNILFHSDHQHVLATDAATFKMASARIYNFIL
jgi:hypothetical protein